MIRSKRVGRTSRPAWRLPGASGREAAHRYRKARAGRIQGGLSVSASRVQPGRNNAPGQFGRLGGQVDDALGNASAAQVGARERWPGAVVTLVVGSALDLTGEAAVLAACAQERHRRLFRDDLAGRFVLAQPRNTEWRMCRRWSIRRTTSATSSGLTRIMPPARR